ncbi:MAG: hypothetical protein KBC83_04475 [Candidatus Moranbacteria bacterium]|jgi:hypothetical protein|nr:hypothetical protein [Candidatus Moranbacteria bacterium]MBP9801891.1 hypothetical protein [Candidatus Moranbacteria bacterium]
MLLFTALIYGILAAGAAFLLESLFLTGLSLNILVLIAGAILEEGAKFIFLFQWRKRFLPLVPILLPYQLFLFTLFGVGFAMVEISLAVPPKISILLSLTSIHILTSLLLGSFLILKKSSPIMLPLGFILAISLHTTYNFIVASLQ